MKYTSSLIVRPTTLWYHDHALGITRLNVYAGLAGFYLIKDAQEKQLNLPKGKYEIPLVMQDRSFNLDPNSKDYGELFYPSQPGQLPPPQTSPLIDQVCLIHRLFRSFSGIQL